MCQGLSLADSPAELSREMQDVVRSQLAAVLAGCSTLQSGVAHDSEELLAQAGVECRVYGMRRSITEDEVEGNLVAFRRRNFRTVSWPWTVRVPRGRSVRRRSRSVSWPIDTQTSV